jgi:SAM-dependent methyltransferase
VIILAASVGICFHGNATITNFLETSIFELVRFCMVTSTVMPPKSYVYSHVRMGVVCSIIMISWIHNTHNLPVARPLKSAQQDCPLCVCTPSPSVPKSESDLLFHQLFSPDDTYYDAEYWEFQRPMGEIGGTLEQWKFRDFIQKGSNCIDFGAGGGFLLHGLQNCNEKLGVELNPHAVAHARDKFGIQLTNDFKTIPDEWADVIFSNHALEHVLCPWCELKRLLTKLKKGSGRLVLVIPAAGRNDDWTGAPDINFHLYTWSPRTLGNLVSSSGFIDVKVDILAHQWPDNPMTIYQTEGEQSFIAKGQQKNKESPYGGCEYQIRVVASRPL